jgi:hypothetical protein
MKMIFVLTLGPENFGGMVTTYRDLLFPVLYATCGIGRKEKKKAQLIDCFINWMKHTVGRN